MLRKLLNNGMYIGTYASVPVYLDLAYVLVVLILGVIDIKAAIIVLSFGLIVLLHEFGHIFAGKYCGCKTDLVKLYVFGGIAFMHVPKDANKEFIITIGGPLVNLLLIFPLYGLIETNYKFVFTFNWLLLVFNLLPAIPLDGGRIFRSILVKISGDYIFATNVACRLSQIICIVMFLYSFQYHMLNLFIISAFVFYASTKELENNYDSEFEN